MTAQHPSQRAAGRGAAPAWRRAVGKAAGRLTLLLLLLLASLASLQAQRRYRDGGRSRDESYTPPLVDRDFHRGDIPDWEVDPHFDKDVFTFVRVYYDSWSGRRWGGKWRTDYPDSELNFSFRLQQLTSIKVNPQPIVLRLTDERIFDYPFLYMCEPGQLMLHDDEVQSLRRYLENGGFLLVDDFWGEDEWHGFWDSFQHVFPNRQWEELDKGHEIFHNVYQLSERPQIPSIHAALSGRSSGRTWERPDAQEVHYRAIKDDNNRIMVLICHNTDLGDGWEREGMHEWYFREFSEKKAYPMGINIVTYAMTH